MAKMLGGGRLDLGLVGAVLCHGLGAGFQHVDILEVRFDLAGEAELVLRLPLVDLLKPDLLGICVLGLLSLASAVELVELVVLVEELAAGLSELLYDVLVGG